MSTSRLDAVYRSLLITKFFTKGWGKPENLRRLFEFRKVISKRDECFKLVDRDYPITITKEENLSDCRLLEGYFDSPLEKCLPGIVPEVAKKAHFQVVLPIQWPDNNCKPVCLHLAGTGDHFFWRRRNLMVKPLLKEAGIGGIILENPFYGMRKPTDQIRSSLHNVSDIFVMGGCLILESLVLFHWCERNGLGPLGVTGLSMGGHMASLAATNWPKPLVLVPCLSWSTASAVFLQGVMARSINWDLLEDQYMSDGVYREQLSKMVTIIDQAFLAGKKFAQTFSENIRKDKPIIHTTGIKTDSKLDITYNEGMLIEDQTIIKAGTQNVLDHNGKEVQSKEDIIEKNYEKHECHNASTKSSVDESVNENSNLNVKAELKSLLDEGKINANLFEKLKSNEKFKLDVNEIAEINKLSEAQIKEVFLNSNNGVENEYGEQKQTNNLTKEVEMTDRSIDNNVPATIDKNTKQPMVVSETKKRSWHVTELTSGIWKSLPFIKQKNLRKIDIAKIHWRDREALQFMRGVMDECTHLSNFSVPYDTSLIIAVCAKHDAYVPREGVGALDDIWPGASVRYVDAGHVSAYLLHQSMFRSCIVESFERSKKRWKDGKHID